LAELHSEHNNATRLIEAMNILSDIQEYFYEKPGRITGVGKALTKAGSFILFAGLVGNVVTGAVEATVLLQNKAASNNAERCSSGNAIVVGS